MLIETFNARDFRKTSWFYSSANGVVESVMPNLTNPITEELYVIEVDGIRRSEHRVFVKALKRALELKQQYPRNDVKLRDAHENTQHDGTPVPKRTWGIGRKFAGARPIKTSHGRISWLNG